MTYVCLPAAAPDSTDHFLRLPHLFYSIVWYLKSTIVTFITLTSFKGLSSVYSVDGHSSVSGKIQAPARLGRRPLRPLLDLPGGSSVVELQAKQNLGNDPSTPMSVGTRCHHYADRQ